jgi:GT2 family glycosyltransferase
VQNEGVKNLPRVSVLLLNRNGRQYLDACFSSLEAQAYPRDRFEVVLVDTGSSDGSIAFVREKYPRTRVFAFQGEQGSCAPYNAAIRSCESRFVALLNDCSRVDPDWLAELVSAAERQDAAVVAPKILDWSGQRIDFAGGVSFIGHAGQVDSRQTAASAADDRPVLFPDGRSALYSRSAFLDAGGFDEDFVECAENVDVGWRLNLLGERVVFAPKAVAYCRQYDVPSRSSHISRLRLLERNALAMIYKNYEPGNLERVLPAAVALCLLRGLQSSGVDTLGLSFSAAPAQLVHVEPRLIAHLIALEDFGSRLPDLKRKRALVQERRRRSDLELFTLFGDPLQLPEIGSLHEEVARVLVRDFKIAEIFDAQFRPSPQPTGCHQPAIDRQRSPSPVQPALPKVSIVILTALGATHLRECLESLRAQTYPGDRVEVIVVDNGSAEDPADEVLARFPGARVIRNETNIGFAAGNNQGSAVATGDYVAFLNDDTRAHPDWLRELVEAARRRRAPAIAGYILDWSGATIDFVDGAMNFEGKGFQPKHGMPADDIELEERPVLFACGCAMLIDRIVLESAGGWDQEAFAYYEDVELGWRLHMLGYEIWFAPRALVYHKHHGTSGRWPEPSRARLQERNSLRALYGLLETESLERALPAALLLAGDRALLDTGLSRAADAPRRSRYHRLVNSTKAALRARGITRSTRVAQAVARLRTSGFLDLMRDALRPRERESRSGRERYRVDQNGMKAEELEDRLQPIPIDAAAVLAGIYGFLADLPKLSQRRADLQRRRRVADREIIERFGAYWLKPCTARLQLEHTALQACLVDAFALNEVDSVDAD